MKIEGPGKTSATRGASKAGGAKKTGDTAFGGMLEETAPAATPKPVSGVNAIGHLDTLLALQEGGGEGSAKKGKQRAAALLDELDKLRIGLLSGGIPKASLQHLTNTLAQHREKIMDPALAEILDEIDLRAQVELAKHGR